MNEESRQMNKTSTDEIRFCAFCPNLCRTNYPTSGMPQREYMTPSALAYLGYAVMNGHIQFDEDIGDVLTMLEAIEECKKACLYGYDIPSHLRELAADLKAS
jgi:hypothetical protein